VLCSYAGALRRQAGTSGPQVSGAGADAHMAERASFSAGVAVTPRGRPDSAASVDRDESSIGDREFLA